MPIIASAKKKLRQDKKRRVVNLRTLTQMKKAVKLARKEPSPKNLASAYSTLDTAAKKRVIHKNKSARLKSKLSKLSGKTSTKFQARK